MAKRVNLKKHISFIAAMSITIILAGCTPTLGTHPEILPCNLDHWVVTNRYVYHLTANGAKKVGIFKPWYKLSRLYDNKPCSWKLENFYYDYNSNRVYFITTSSIRSPYRFYSMDLNNEMCKPKLLLADCDHKILHTQDQLFVAKNISGHFGLYAINLNSNKPRLENIYVDRDLFQPEFADQCGLPAISPSGNLVAFISKRSLWIIDLHSKQKTLLQPGVETTPFWISNSEIICAPLNDKKEQLTIINVISGAVCKYEYDDSILDQVYHDGSFEAQALSPDLKNLLLLKFHRTNHLLLFNVEQKTFTFLIETERGKFFEWLPNSKSFLILDRTENDPPIYKQGLYYYSFKHNNVSDLGVVEPRAHVWQVMPNIDQNLILSNAHNDAQFQRWASW